MRGCPKYHNILWINQLLSSTIDFDRFWRLLLLQLSAACEYYGRVFWRSSAKRPFSQLADWFSTFSNHTSFLVRVYDHLSSNSFRQPISTHTCDHFLFITSVIFSSAIGTRDDLLSGFFILSYLSIALVEGLFLFFGTRGCHDINLPEKLSRHWPSGKTVTTRYT